MGVAAVVVGLSKFRVELDGLVIGSRPVIVALEAIVATAVVIDL